MSRIGTASESSGSDVADEPTIAGTSPAAAGTDSSTMSHQGGVIANTKVIASAMDTSQKQQLDETNDQTSSSKINEHKTRRRKSEELVKRSQPIVPSPDLLTRGVTSPPAHKYAAALQASISTRQHALRKACQKATVVPELVRLLPPVQRQHSEKPFEECMRVMLSIGVPVDRAYRALRYSQGSVAPRLKTMPASAGGATGVVAGSSAVGEADLNVALAWLAVMAKKSGASAAAAEQKQEKKNNERSKSKKKDGGERSPSTTAYQLFHAFEPVPMPLSDAEKRSLARATAYEVASKKKAKNHTKQAVVHFATTTTTADEKAQKPGDVIIDIKDENEGEDAKGKDIDNVDDSSDGAVSSRMSALTSTLIEPVRTVLSSIRSRRHVDEHGAARYGSVSHAEQNDVDEILVCGRCGLSRYDHVPIPVFGPTIPEAPPLSVEKRDHAIVTKAGPDDSNDTPTANRGEKLTEVDVHCVPKSATSFKCCVCFCDCTMDELFVFASPPNKRPCRHGVCIDCETAYLTSQITSGSVMKLKCCGFFTCTQEASAEDVKVLLSAELQERYQRLKGVIELSMDPSVRFCTTPDCDGYMKGSKRKRRLKCPKCSKEMCFSCAKDYHKGSCIDDIKYAEWAGSHDTGACPRCRSRVEKVSGCNHMTCYRCKYQWCWLCGSRYTGLHFMPGNIFGCGGLQSARPETFKKWYVRWPLRFLSLVLVLIALPFALLFGWIFFVHLEFDNVRYRARKYSKWKKRFYLFFFYLFAFLLTPLVDALVLIAVIPVLTIIWCKDRRDSWGSSDYAR